MGFIRTHWKLIGIVVLIVIIGVVLVNRFSTSTTNTSITTAKAKQGTFTQTITSSGKTKAETSADLRFQTSGKLSYVGVKEGDAVSRGQVIAKLDDREVQKRLKDALLDYSKQRHDYEEKWRVTYDGKHPTDAFNDTVRRILEKNQWDLDKAVLDVEIQSLAVEFSTLVSPISGVVTHVDTPVAGVNITPASAVFSVSDISTLIFEASVDETDVSGLTVGQPAVVMLDAFPEATFSGTISYISYVSQQSGGGATVFPVKISIDQPEHLRIGLNGDIEIITSRVDNALLIPVEAIREADGRTYVFRKHGTTYEKTTVLTGQKNEDDIVILSGLTEGDDVVVKGFSSIPK